MSRTFELKPATREAVPLFIGIVGPSGSGKTMSALEIATGGQRVTGGDIAIVDTEARRSLAYADKYKFRHLDFKAPFGPLDYLDAIESCAKQGAKWIIVDSASHEHEGPGGVLEQHASEQERLARAWKTTLDKVNMSAWQKPKGDRRRLLNTMIQMPVNFVMCFRAKEKVDLRGEKPKPLGWMPIAGEEFVYESTLTCLLYPGSNGVPSWHPDEMGEKATIKLPGHFRGILTDRVPLSVDVGERLARWAAGDVSAPAPVGVAPGPESRADVERQIWELLGKPPGSTWFVEKFGRKRATMSDAEIVEARNMLELERRGTAGEG